MNNDVENLTNGKKIGDERRRTKDVGTDGELPILEALASEPSLSQRELARRAGLSLTKAHFILRRLVESGLVKVQNVATSNHKLGYLYLLTEKGHEEKARLTYAFLHKMAAQYRDMMARVDGTLDAAVQRLNIATTPIRVGVVGQGPLAEVVSDAINLRQNFQLARDPKDADAVVVVDPELSGSVRADMPRVQFG